MKFEFVRYQKQYVMSSALQLLSGYDSHSDEESDIDNHVAKRRRLPLPTSLKPAQFQEVCDDPVLHDGRQRIFPHKRGNWSSLIYIPYKTTESYDFLFDQLLEICSPDVKLMKVKDPHISLTKTFVLLYHWIKEFYVSIKEKMKAFHSYDICFNGLKVYCNEQFSRSFIALAVGVGKKELASSVQLLDKCLEEYRLKPFYEEGSFHMSIAWCHGDKKASIEDKISKMENLMDIFVGNPDLTISVTGYILKTGFKEFMLNLG